MPRRRERRAREGWADDPLVSINVPVLQALLKERGWGPSDLAHQAGTKQQNISHLLRSDAQRRCRRSLRARIAKALQAPEALLADERAFEPSAPHVFPRREYRHTVRTELAASRLFTKVMQTIERDGESAGPLPQWLAAVVIEQVAELVRIRDWRQKLLVWPEGAEAERGYSEPPIRDVGKLGEGEFVRRDVPAGMESQYPPGIQLYSWKSQAVPEYDPAHEAAILGLITAVEYLLTPWFDGDAELNYHSLRLLADHVPHMTREATSLPYSPTDPRAAVAQQTPNVSGGAES